MGVYRKLYKEKVQDELFRDLKASTMFEIQYYNRHSLVFEPLIEPWNLNFTMK